MMANLLGDRFYSQLARCCPCHRACTYCDSVRQRRHWSPAHPDLGSTSMHRRAQVQAKALRGVGTALPALAAGAAGSPGSAAALDGFLDAVDGARKATQPTEMRAAAVQALQASSLLGPASADSGGACLCSAPGVGRHVARSDCTCKFAVLKGCFTV